MTIAQVQQEPYSLLTDPVGIALVLYSVAVVALILERLIARMRMSKLQAGFIEQAQEMLAQPDRARITKRCEGSNAPLARALTYVLKHEVTDSPESTEKLLDDGLEFEANRMRKHLVLLACLAATAPFLGLLGTVMGIIDTFNSIMQSGVSDPATISYGIARALETTAAGLAIAIPAFIAYNLLANKANVLVRDYEAQANRILIAMGEM